LPTEEDITYKASKTCAEFHQSDDFVRELIGPFGSGKSVACVIEVLIKAMAQQIGPDGLRRSRWAIVRNSYRELQDTTINTWNDWIPDSIAFWKHTTMTCTLRFNDVVCEVLFRALDKPQDVKKLLSLELTGAWLNEAKEIPKPIFDAVQGRIGRYPAKKDGGPSWYGLIIDTNPPDSDHYLYRIMEEDKPDGHSIYHQPSGLSDGAENRENLPENYYERMALGKDREWINVYIHGKYGFVQDGKVIYPEYQDHVHCSDEELEYDPTKVLYIGIDFGLTPAAVMAQQQPSGQWQMLDEYVTEDMGATKFARELKKHLGQYFARARMELWGDPAGVQRAQTDAKTPFDVLANNGLPAAPTFTNDFLIRRDCVGNLFTRLDMGGNPAILISPKCKQLRKALAGGYKFRRLRVAGDERYEDHPNKNKYSHVAEAQQYLLLGAGEGYNVTSSESTSSTKVLTTLGHR